MKMKKLIITVISILFYTLILQLLSSASILSNEMFYLAKEFYIGCVIIIVSVLIAL